jgi:SAM-dependent methyltransferase
MARDTDRDWSKVAEENPYWGVLSEDQFRGTELSAESKLRFYESGKGYFGNLLGFVRKHIVPDFTIGRGLDFGCGVGRLLIPLAHVAQEAVGIDVAPKMLELTTQNLAEAGITNASAVRGDDDLSLVTGSFNFVNSYIVLQHIPPERGIHLIRRLLQLLEVGGIFSLQMTYAKERRFFQHERGKAAYYRRSGLNIQDMVPVASDAPEGTITMFDYDLNEVILTIAEFSGQPIMMLPTNHDGHIGAHFIGMKARS